MAGQPGSSSGKAEWGRWSAYRATRRSFLSRLSGGAFALVVRRLTAAAARVQGDARQSQPAEVGGSSRQPLLDPKTFEKDWFFFSAEPTVKRADVWVLSTQGGSTLLQCRGKGKPFGYVRTVRAFQNFRLGLQWMFPDDENGNSGVLINTDAVGTSRTAGDKIWPRAIQIQLHRPKAGSVFPSGGAKTDNTLDVKNLSKPLGQWNTGVIVVRDGTLTATINGRMVGKVTGCVPDHGSIALQCEGSNVYFRDLWIEPLPPVPKASPETGSKAP